jgi:hypothetical protein
LLCLLLASCYIHILPKRRLTFNGLHGVISHKAEPFITTAVRTSNPTKLFHLTKIYERGDCELTDFTRSL